MGDDGFSYPWARRRMRYCEERSDEVISRVTQVGSVRLPRSLWSLAMTNPTMLDSFAIDEWDDHLPLPASVRCLFRRRQDHLVIGVLRDVPDILDVSDLIVWPDHEDGAGRQPIEWPPVD